MTTPDRERLMKDASLIIAGKGGRTSHAAIIAREFGIPAIVGWENATRRLTPLLEVTGTCAEGETALVFDGIHPLEVEPTEVDTSIELEIKINVGFPPPGADRQPAPGGRGGPCAPRVHPHLRGPSPFPRPLLPPGATGLPGDRQARPRVSERFHGRLEAEGEEELRGILGAIDRRTAAYANKRRFFVDLVMEGVGLICAAFHPHPVLVCLSAPAVQP
ncbi:MAG: PEP-utilizing enzyme, partial [Planctomycetota bacterium]